MNNPVLILYLEDNPRDAELVRDKLQQLAMPHELRIATGRAQYEAALAETRFDLIMSDYALPDYDGFAALALALEKRPGVPFILISGTLSEEQAVECLRRGATDYVIKQNLKRLVPAMLRALTEAGEHKKRRAAEKTLRESEKRFMDVIYAARDAILLIEDGKFVDCNEATAQMLGYASRDAFLTSHPSQLSPPLQPDGRESFEKADEMMRKAIENGSHQFEWVHRRANGEDFPVEVSLTAISFGGKTMLHCLWHDITETQRREEEIQRLGNQRAMILNSTSEGILGLDTEGRHTFINPVAAGMLGYEVAELKGQPSHEIWHHTKSDGSRYPPEDCPIFAAFRDGKVHSSDREVFWRKDGTSFPVEYTSTPILEGGELLGAVVAFRDITERKRATAEIQQQLDELRRWQAVMLGREDRNMKLKREVNELLRRLGEPVRYPSQESSQ